MPQELPEITAEDAIEIVKLFEHNRIELYIDGGWGVDALLGRQTRSHQDLDIAVKHQDVTKIRVVLAANGCPTVRLNMLRLAFKSLSKLTEQFGQL